MRRVAITGMGIVSSIGMGVSNFWNSAKAGVSSVSDVSLFNVDEYRTNKACEIKAECIKKDGKTQINRTYKGRAGQFVLTSCEEALKDSKLPIDKMNKYRIGVSVGTTGGEMQLLERITSSYLKNNSMKDIIKQEISQYPHNQIVGLISKEYDLCGSSVCLPISCAAGNFAVGYGFEQIKTGKADAMICGGVEVFNKITYTGFYSLKSMSADLCRPFDVNRSGILFGEGAGILVLEDMAHALKRNAQIYAEIKGFGVSSDGYHVSSPEPNGDGMLRAMKQALEFAKIKNENIELINAHGTGTPLNDRIECAAIKRLFGQDAKKMNITSIKSLIGHTIGASGAISCISGVLSIRDNCVPPTINNLALDPECDLNIVLKKKKEVEINNVLINAFGFGGSNSSLLIAKKTG